MDELLTLSHVYAGYDRRDIVQDVSLSLPRGQFCALLGANGSGKTTLLKTVCGFLPFRGDCRFLGKPLGDFSPKERSRHMGYLAQRGGVTIPLSVGDVVLMGCNPVLGVFQQPGKRHREAALAALEQVGLACLWEKDFLSLSEGQRQLVLFARSRVLCPELLVLDEPDSALDFQNRHRMMALLRRTVEEGNSVLLCSHDAGFAMQYADRLLLLKDGRLVHDLFMAEVEDRVLQKALSDLYGPVELLRRGNLRVMVKGERELESDGANLPL